MDRNEIFDNPENIISEDNIEEMKNYVNSPSDEEFDEPLKNLNRDLNEYELDFMDLMEEEDTTGFNDNENRLDEKELLKYSTSTTADLTVPKDVLDMYSKNQIIYSPAFYTSPYESYPSRNCRINIYSYEMYDERDITIGDETYHLNRFSLNPFKIIDIYKINNVTQLTLIPVENYDLAYMKSNTLEIEDELIKKSRDSFEKSFDNEITPNLTSEKNILPIGVYKYNDEYRLYNKIELCQMLAVFIRLSDFLKEEYLYALHEPSILNQIYMECLDYENENMDKENLNALTTNGSTEDANMEDMFLFADELLDLLNLKLINPNSKIEGFILNDFDENDVIEKHIDVIKEAYSKIYSDDRESFVKSLLIPDISSPKTLIKFEKEVMKIYKEHLSTYIYESNLPDKVIKLYKKGQILNKATPIKAQTKEHKPTKTCIFKIILPYQLKFDKNSQTDPEDKICKSYSSEKFKLIDIYEKNNVTQLTIMGIFPEDEFLFKQKNVSLEKQLIKKSRDDFEKSFKLDSTYETFNNKPLGMYKQGEKYKFYQSSDMCNLLDIKTRLFDNLPLSQASEYNKKIDMNKLLLEYNKFSTEKQEIKSEIDAFFYSKGVSPVKCDEFSKTIPSIIDKLLKEED